MDSSLDDILDRLNRGENPSLSELESDDGLIRHGGLNKSDILKMLTDGIRIMVSAAIIMTIVVLSPLKSAFQPNDGASHAGGKTVRAQKLYEIGNLYYFRDDAEHSYEKPYRPLVFRLSTFFWTSPPKSLVFNTYSCQNRV